MKCQRCSEDQEAKYRVRSDVLDLKVCTTCAAEARKLRLTIELLHDDETSRDSAIGGAKERAA
jgi:hypothetical protein